MNDLYRMFIQEYIEDANEEMNKYLGEENKPLYLFDEEGEENAKKDVYKINYFLRDNLQIPYVSDVLSKKINQDKLIEFTGKFMDDHANQLSTSGPVYTFTFGDKETSFLYELFNVNAEKLLDLWYKTIEETYYGNISAFFTGWIQNAPHKLLMVAMLIESVQKGYEDMITCCEYLWAFAEYPIIYREYWKTGVKEDVMNYTIEHLGNKFKIKVKKLNNLQALLKYDATSAVLSFMDRLKEGADNVYADFMQRMRNQLNNTLKNISRVYYKNSEDNATQHNKQSEFDDGTLTDQEGITTNISQIVDNTINKFGNAEINSSILKVAAEGSQVDKNNLSGFISQIYSTKDNKLPKFVENIITAYFDKNPTDTSIQPGAFVTFGFALYRSIGTSKNPLYAEIRSILDYWMYKIIDIRSIYSREPTCINYTRAIFNYMILMINHYN